MAKVKRRMKAMEIFCNPEVLERLVDGGKAS